MQDSSTGDYGKEAMLDYQISWLMRLSMRCTENVELNKISRFVVLHLLGKENETDVQIREVEVWKQWKYIDVLAEVTLLEQGKEEKHVVVIENKVYTKLRDGQLNQNSSAVRDYYKDSPFIHFWLINCNEATWEEFEESCKEADEEWKQLWFYDVIGGKLQNPIGYDLFDEFWVRSWC